MIECDYLFCGKMWSMYGLMVFFSIGVNICVGVEGVVLDLFSFGGAKRVIVDGDFVFRFDVGFLLLKIFDCVIYFKIFKILIYILFYVFVVCFDGVFLF